MHSLFSALSNFSACSLLLPHIFLSVCSLLLPRIFLSVCSLLLPCILLSVCSLLSLCSLPSDCNILSLCSLSAIPSHFQKCNISPKPWLLSSKGISNVKDTYSDRCSILWQFNFVEFIALPSTLNQIWTSPVDRDITKLKTLVSSSSSSWPA